MKRQAGENLVESFYGLTKLNCLKKSLNTIVCKIRHQININLSTCHNFCYFLNEEFVTAVLQIFQVNIKISNLGM